MLKTTNKLKPTA